MAASSAGQTARITQGLVLRAVTVVDTRTGKLAPNMAVVIQDGRIASILPDRSITVSRSAQSIEARGRFVVPGYLDMHAHPLDASDPQHELALMLANGITGFRQMSGSPTLLEQRRLGQLSSSNSAAPELLAMPGSVLTPHNGPSIDAAVAEVDRQWSQGADFVKVINLPPAVFYAALKQAGSRGLPFVGHLPSTIEPREASRAGMKSIEHMGPGLSFVMGCSTDETQLRNLLKSQSQQTPAHDPTVSKNAARLALANGALMAPPVYFDSIRRALKTYDAAKCQELATTLRENGTWVVPTLVRLRAGALTDDPNYLDDPRLRHAPDSTRQFWQEVRAEFLSKLSKEDRDALASQFALQMRIIRLLNERGAPLLAGSDAGGLWEIAGFALHDEFDLLAEAGVPPLRILQMTTLNGAEFLGRQETMGSVQQGRNADLVLLEANPVADARNLHRIFAVVRAGKLYPRHALDEMMAEALKKVELSDQKPGGD